VTLHVQNNIVEVDSACTTILKNEDEPKCEYELKNENNLRNDAPKIKKTQKRRASDSQESTVELSIKSKRLLI